MKVSSKKSQEPKKSPAKKSPAKKSKPDAEFTQAINFISSFFRDGRSPEFYGLPVDYSKDIRQRIIEISMSLKRW